MNTPLERYHDYLACLNRQAWDELHQFINDQVRYNHQEIGLAGYRTMLQQNFRDIPDLYFQPELLVANDSIVACRLAFNCTPIEILCSFLLMDVKSSSQRMYFINLARTK
jgi:predicted ester cyclase